MDEIVHETLLIDGAWRAPLATDTAQVVSPSTEQVISRVPAVGAQDVDRAVAAARRAFDDGPWPRSSTAKRVAVLARGLELLAERAPHIADLVSAEMGLPTSVSSLKTPGAVKAGHWFLSLADAGPADVRQTPWGPAAVVAEPVGVVAAIAPWNSPFNMAIAKIVPALVVGCTVVYKPASQTPLDAFEVARAFHDAGLPAGVLNLVTGGGAAGHAMVADPRVDKISFTGSTGVGREIAAVSGPRFARMQLELGGKSAAIVLDDADPETVARGIAAGSFGNTGQICAAFSRIIVPAAQRDRWVDAIVETARSFVVGDPFDPATTMGPIASKAQRDTVLDYVAVGRDQGARIVTGGARPQGLDRGYYVEPTVFVDVDVSMRIAREEIFGPVVTIQTHTSLEEAVAIANDSDYGLHGGVFTTDPERAARVARSVRTGTFSVNSYTHNVQAPFGGVKDSGVGRDMGAEALEAYRELKTVNLTEATVPFFS